MLEKEVLYDDDVHILWWIYIFKQYQITLMCWVSLRNVHIYLHFLLFINSELLKVVEIDQSHRYGRPQAACREPAGSNDKTTRTAICFEHKMQYLF